MKNVKRNWYLITGILIIAVVLTLKQFINLPEAVREFGLGLGIGLELLGVYSENHDMSKIRSFKRNMLNAFLK